MKNKKIREMAEAKGIRLWQIAEKLGINDSNFSRKLRKELSADETVRILDIIEQLAAEKA